MAKGLLILGLLSALAAQARQHHLDNVAEKYLQLCASCHGHNLEGSHAVSLRDEMWLHGGDDESVARSIRLGYPDSGMPAWGAVLSEAEIHNLVVFLRERRLEQTGQPLTERDHDIDARPLPTVEQRSKHHSFHIELVVEGFEAPYAFALLPDGRMLVTEKHDSRLRLVRDGELVPEPIAGIPETHRDPKGYGTLLDVLPHPDYERNGWIYLSYGERCRHCKAADAFDGELPAVTTLIRGRIHNGVWVDQQTIWRAPAQRYVPPSDFYAGRMAFDGKGYLYFSIGINDLIREQAQDLAHPKGKIHRIHDDGRVPIDNPFISESSAYKSIWSYGHRNPQGLAFDRKTGQLWSSEHGPRGGDELNLIYPGRNYGWPVITTGMNYDGTPLSEKTAQVSMEQPVVEWTPSIAVSSVSFYEGNAYPKWRHSLLLTSLKQEELIRLVIEGGRVIHSETIVKNIGRLRDIEIGPNGIVYLLVEIRSAARCRSRIVRLVPE